MEFKKGDIIYDEKGGEIKILDPISDIGSQAEIYAVNHNGDVKALKWYRPEAVNTSLVRNIDYHIQHGAPCKEFVFSRN